MLRKTTKEILWFYFEKYFEKYFDFDFEKMLKYLSQTFITTLADQKVGLARLEFVNLRRNILKYRVV